jgi:hypothetical protein
MPLSAIGLLVCDLVIIGGSAALSLYAHQALYFVAGFSLAFGVNALYFVVTGEARTNLGSFYRSNDPLGYWTTIVWLAASSLVWGVVALMMIWRNPPPGSTALFASWFVASVLAWMLLLAARRR